MKTTIKSLVLAIIFILTSALGFSQNKKENNIDDSNIALQGYSAVSYLDMGLAQRGTKQFKTIHNKIAYYFTSAEQKEKFDKNPTKYLPQYGGFCAFGVYVGAKFRVDPNKFVISNGKYYLFLNDLEVDAKQLWISEKEPKLIKTANKNWKSLRSK
ncbi:YHS domain-containing (seleno)protein [Pseudotenacibaculum sp. MALMAid0570]|uniref:YHS domain-containing (seleno)protein n=1 Tax=Pseudotenacibaculum sp. MALMAid0570 TaxID=3143938 RepID=UPI0032DFCED9